MLRICIFYLLISRGSMLHTGEKLDMKDGFKITLVKTSYHKTILS